MVLESRARCPWCCKQNRLKQVAISGGSTVQFGYSGGGSRLWKKVNGQVTGLWIGSLYEEKDGKILCHVYAGDRLVATFEPESTLACIIQNNRYLAGIYNNSHKALIGVFGHGRAPLSGMALAILAGLGCGIVYSRKRLWQVHGFTSPAAPRLFLRQMLLMSLVGSIVLSGIPAPAYAGTPSYDPVFYYYHPDHLGSAQLMTDRAGEVVQHYGYTPFGKESYQNNTYAFEVSSRYTGQTLDEDTGLYYYGARYYDPELARFIQADSTVPDPEFSQAYNRYAYVYNNPLKFSDPTGQFPHLVVIAAIQAAQTAAVEAFVIKVVVTGIISSAVSAGIAAATGGSVAQAGRAGLVGGFAGAAGGVAGAVAAGALSAEMAGGDPLTGAITAGVTVGLAAAFGHIPVPTAFNTLEEVFLWQLGVSTASGALVGGVAAEISGGDFGQGAAHGALGAAAGFILASALTEHILIPFAEKHNKPAYLTIKTQNGKAYTVKLADAGDWAAEILKYSQSQDKIMYLKHEGHGLGGWRQADAGLRGKGLIIGEEILYGDLQGIRESGTYGLDRLIATGALKNAFAPGATIEIRACYSAYGKNSFAHILERAIPNATVRGYRGVAWGLGSPVSHHTWWFSRMTEVNAK